MNRTVDIEQALSSLLQKKRLLEIELAEVEKTIEACRTLRNYVAHDLHRLEMSPVSVAVSPQLHSDKDQLELSPYFGLRENIRRLARSHKGPMHYKNAFSLLISHGIDCDLENVRITCYQLGPGFNMDQGYVFVTDDSGEKPRRNKD